MASLTGQSLHLSSGMVSGSCCSVSTPDLLLCKLGNNPVTCQLPCFFLFLLGVDRGMGSRLRGPRAIPGRCLECQAFPLPKGGCGDLGPGSSTGWAAQGQWVPDNFLTLDLLFSGHSSSSTSSLSLRIPICGTIHLSLPSLGPIIFPLISLRAPLRKQVTRRMIVLTC